MNRFLVRATVIIIATVVVVGSVFSQASWKYKREIKFPVADSLVNPYLCTVDAAGNIWVISSTASSATAHNGVWKAGPTDTVMTQIGDFTSPADPNVHSTRGIASLGNDVVVTGWKPGAISAFLYRYPGGDPARLQKWGSGIAGSGYGSSFMGVAATKDSFLFQGYGIKLRGYNFNGTVTTPAYGSYLSNEMTALDPRGNATTATNYRDVAVNPAGNYHDSTTVLYAVRSSSDAAPSAGGVGLIIGGKQTNLKGYRVKAVADLNFDISPLGKSNPYGIAVDGLGQLYVAGTDTMKRWVKIFTVDTLGNASFVDMLPSKTNATEFDRDPNGAPLNVVGDVALDAAGTKAFVTDQASKRVFVFEKTSTGVEVNPAFIPARTSLGQNYPNPFNPSTTIRVDLAQRVHITLTVHDMLGRVVATLANSEWNAGTHLFLVDARERTLASGMYVYRLQAGNVSEVRQMLLVK